jgi:hypothetical protein
MARGDGRLALKVLERIGIADRPTPGPRDAEDVKREQDLEKRKRDVERRKKEADVRLEDMTLDLRG